MTQHLRTWTSLLVGAAIVVCLSACGESNTVAAPPMTPVSTEKPNDSTAKPVAPDPSVTDPTWSGQPKDGVALPDTYEIVSNVLMPSESYLPKADGMPTGVVLLDTREPARNESLCAALLGSRTATVRTETEARRDNPSGDYLVTHWLSRAALSNEGDCPALMAEYDFERARQIKTTYGLGERRGPIFLALDASGEMVFLDLGEATREEVFKATSDWMQLALKAPQSGPGAGRPPRPPGLVASANQLFARLASGFGTLAHADAAPISLRFNDPATGVARTFTIYRSGVYLIGATFLL